MGATERFETIINRDGLPDRIPIHLMGIPAYSDAMIEFIEREDEIMEHDPFFLDDDNILITPLGDKTLPYYFGAEDAMYSTGIKKDMRCTLDASGNIVKDPAEAARLESKPEGKYVNYMGRLNGWRVLDSGHKY
ncbi:hypothetical protein GF325_07645, partial [Candidatus Bathyarchaeota archaeon]|nr:hypothetical protein [Candidatus Bathyarchaeota archaeon]